MRRYGGDRGIKSEIQISRWYLLLPVVENSPYLLFISLSCFEEMFDFTGGSLDPGPCFSVASPLKRFVENRDQQSSWVHFKK
jgi:hypothetical protein